MSLSTRARVVQLITLALAIASLAYAVAFALGGNGAAVLTGPVMTRLFPEAAYVMNTDVVVTQTEAMAAIGTVTAAQLPPLDGPVAGASELGLGTSTLSFWSVTTAERWAWIASSALPYVLLGLMWWLLSRLAAQTSRQQPFTGGHSRLVTWLAVAVGVGVPLAGWVRWRVVGSLIEASTAADIVTAPSFAYPVWSLGVAAALAMAAALLRRGAEQEDDLEGLV